jgi:DNA invertase Pin-like site-specific DNA recombinase
MTKPVIYARYSSDNQKETSIEDQRRICMLHAEREGWIIQAEYIDKETSGRFDDRPGFNMMMADAVRRKFDTIIVNDLSRLSRSSSTATLVEEFAFHGVRLIAITDGIDSNAPGSNLHVGFKAMMNHEFLEQMAKNVHRGLSGKAIKGHNVGGRSYGYRHVPHFSKTKSDIYGQPELEFVTREPDEEQAKWVRQIFDWTAEGRSYHWIACELNRQGVKSVRGGTWTTSTICGSSNNPHAGILNNPLYLGRFIWNRTETVRNPRTKQTKAIWREESEWIVVDMPELRLITEETWQAVKARQASKKINTEEKQESSENPKARTGPGPKYLFSGILKCEKCGGDFITISPGKYGCSNTYRRGTCDVKLKLNRDEVEKALTRSLVEDLFKPEAITAFREEAAKLLKERKSNFEPAIKMIKNQKKDIEVKIENILSFIEKGQATDSITGRLEKLEQEKIKIEEQLSQQTSHIQEIEPFMPRPRWPVKIPQ